MQPELTVSCGRPDLARCPVCLAGDPVEVMRHAPAPAVQLALCDTPDQARGCPTGVLDLVACPRCEYIWNRSFEPAKVEFDARYESDQTHSAAFSAHVDDVVARVVAALPASGCLLEIGAGQGYFLKRAVARAGDRVAAAFGFEPAWGGRPTPPRTTIFERLFDDEAGGLLERPADVVVTRHVVQYVADPVPFLEAIRVVMGDDDAASSRRLFLETRCIEPSLRRGAIEDFCYEVCAYPDAGSLGRALGRAGFTVRRADTLFDGQYLLIEAAPGRPGPVTATGGLLDLARRFATRADTAMAAIRDRLESAARRGKVALWGAGTKGVALATRVDPDASLLDCLIDLNPAKQGRYLPMTGHPVVDAATAARRGVRTSFPANAAYRDEIAASVAAAGLPIEVETLPTGAAP